MNQTIFSKIYPSLNLSQSSNQAAHLIEHLLLSRQRLTEAGVSPDFQSEAILDENGYTSELMMAEYYVVKSEFTSQLSQFLGSQSSLEAINEDDFQRAKESLVQEVRERQAPIIGLAEQFERAIYTDNSPAVRQPWFNIESVAKVQLSGVKELIRANPGQEAELSFDRYTLPPSLNIEKNTVLAGKRQIDLTHPYQAPKTAYVSLLIPLSSLSVSYPMLDLYIASLANYRLGLLFNELRYSSGLIYDLAVYSNYYADCLCIEFSCAESQATIATERTFEILRSYSQKINDLLPLLVRRLSNDLQLTWANVRLSALRILEEAVIGNVRMSPSERLKLLPEVSKEDLDQFNNNILRALNESSLIVVRRYGEQPSTSIA